MRVLADLSDDDISWLDSQAVRLGTSRAQLLREAVSAYRDAAGRDGLERFYGIWQDRERTGR